MLVFLFVSAYVCEYVIINDKVMEIVENVNDVNLDRADAKNNYTDIVSDELFCRIRYLNADALDDDKEEYGKENIVANFDLYKSISWHCFVSGTTRFKYISRTYLKDGTEINASGAEDEKVPCYIKWKFDLNGLKIIEVYQAP